MRVTQWRALQWANWQRSQVPSPAPSCTRFPSRKGEGHPLDSSLAFLPAQTQWEGADPAVSEGSRKLRLRVESRLRETNFLEDTQEAPSNPIFKDENSEQVPCGDNKGIVQLIQEMDGPECTGME